MPCSRHSFDSTVSEGQRRPSITPRKSGQHGTADDYGDGRAKDQAPRRHGEIEPTRGVLSLADTAKVNLDDVEKLKFISDCTRKLYGHCANRLNDFRRGNRSTRRMRHSRHVAGRTIDCLSRQRSWLCGSTKPLNKVPDLKWTRLAEASEEKRLLSGDEIEKVLIAAKANHYGVQF
jgi:hypothetical protein